jgi:YegS/Rv2252/BmrU family lipid kinase
VASIAVVINPISGTGGRLEVARRRAELAAALLVGRGVEADIFLTERGGHARELTQAALERGVATVIAWGGDGTVNEVASVLAFERTALGIVPSGSGNGLARELRIPFDPAQALDIALRGDTRCIDAGELDGHLFFNIAGIGLDARVAHRFAVNGIRRRGFRLYLEIAAQELFAGVAGEHTIVTDGDARRVRTLLIALANARQYGNRALIAPDARLDDGRLDVVVVEDRPAVMAMLQAPRVFLGQIARIPGVTIRRAVNIEVASGEPVMYHVDGEPFVGGASVTARCRPGALNVKVPGGP